MKFNLNFLKQFVPVTLTPDELAHELTMAGAQLASLTKTEDDAIFDIEITSNRPDLLSMVGISHELAGILSKKPAIAVRKPRANGGKRTEIAIKDTQGCLFYRAVLIEGVRVGSTPSDMKDILEKAGFASVNNIVDITNYCMLKWGHPLHAFDRDKINGGIVVRRARQQERIVCLDNKERVLDEEALVIADRDEPIALAGIIGGQNTEISAQTKNVLLEAALFVKGRVRIGRRRFGVATESSYRFERDIISQYLFAAQDEAADLICRHCGGAVTGISTQGKAPVQKKVRVPISIEKLNKYLGTDLSAKQIKKLLERVPCSVSSRGVKTLMVQPPWFRNDIRRDVDMYEEVARRYRYENIPLSLLELPVSVPHQNEGLFAFKNKLRHFLRGERLREIITYSFLHDEKLSFAGEEDRLVEIINPLKKDERFLRNSLWLTAVDALRHNLQNAAEDIRFFEIGDVFTQQQGVLTEEPRLGIFFVESEQTTIYSLINVVENLCLMLAGEKPELAEVPLPCFKHRLRLNAGGIVIGSIGMLDGVSQQKLDLSRQLFVADLSIEALRKLYSPERRYRSFSRFPEVVRDISIALKIPKNFAEIRSEIQDNAPDFLKDIGVVGIYTGEKIEKGFRGYTIRIKYQSSDKTLSSEEVDAAHARIREKLSAVEGVVLR